MGLAGKFFILLVLKLIRRVVLLLGEGAEGVSAPSPLSSAYSYLQRISTIFFEVQQVL